MRPFLSSIIALLLSLGVYGDGRGTQAAEQSTAAPPAAGPQKPVLSPAAAAEARRIIVAWLECEECISEELDAVKNLGSVAIPSLAASLREGPSPASRESLRRHLLETYEELKAYEETHPKQKVAQSKMEFVNTYMENYVAQYQIRAAQALAAIGGPEAQKGLSDALKVTLSDDVRIVVREALGRSKE